MYVPLVHWKRDKLPINVPSNLTGKDCLFAGTSGQNQNVGTTHESLTSYNYPLCPASGVEKGKQELYLFQIDRIVLVWSDLLTLNFGCFLVLRIPPHPYQSDSFPVDPYNTIAYLMEGWWYRHELTHFSYQLSNIHWSIFTFPSPSTFCYVSDECVIVDCKITNINLLWNSHYKKKQKEKWKWRMIVLFHDIIRRK